MESNHTMPRPARYDVLRLSLPPPTEVGIVCNEDPVSVCDKGVNCAGLVKSGRAIGERVLSCMHMACPELGKRLPQPATPEEQA